jgi:hypothetical protein
MGDGIAASVNYWVDRIKREKPDGSTWVHYLMRSSGVSLAIRRSRGATRRMSMKRRRPCLNTARAG